MKHVLLLVAVLALAWGAWSLFSSPEPTGDVGYEDDWIDGSDEGSSDLRDVTNTPDDGMVGVGGTQEDGTGDGAGGKGDPERRLELVGRVVDARRQPVGGAQVELQAEGRLVGRSSSGPDGVFRLPTRSGLQGRALRGMLIARKEGYGAAMHGVWLAGNGALTAPTLVLQTAHRLRARVDVDGAPSPFARVAVVRRASGQVTPFGVRAVGEDGHASFDGLAPGLYEVYATLPGRGRGLARARLPQAEGEVAVIALGGERLLDVIVEDASTGEPVPDATLLVGDKRTLPEPTGPGYTPPIPVPTTNGSGRATVRGLGLEETVYISVKASGFVDAYWWQASGQVARPGVSEVRVRLRRPRRMTFPIFAGDAAPPEDGTPLRVELAGRMAIDMRDIAARVDGSYVIIDGLPATATSGALIAPGGLRAQFTAPLGADMGNAVEFLAPRAVRVRVVEPGGAPVEALALRINPLDGVGRGPTATTDADGVATFEGITAPKASVHLKQAGTPWGGPLLGRIDLTSDQEEFTFELVARLAFVLEVRIDGERMLPSEYVLSAGGVSVPSEAVVEDPTTGELQVTLRPPSDDQPFRLELNAQGYLPVRILIDPRQSGGTYDAALTAAGRIRARVTPPADGNYGLNLERYDEGLDVWTPASGNVLPGGAPPETGDGVHIYDGLATGRYRLVDSRTGYRGRALEVREGGGTVDVSVDLTGAVNVTGKVAAPRGANLAQARVRVVGRHSETQAWSGARVAADGTFVIRALRGERIELVVAHPTLSPAEDGGRVQITAGTGTPTLRLVAGAQATFRLPGGTGAPSIGGSAVQVQLFRGAPGEDLALAVTPSAAGGVYTFGGFSPGTYTLWMTFGNRYAPLVRTGVQLEQGTTDLGTIEPGSGSTLVVVLTGRRKDVAVWASVSHQGKPVYSRSASLSGSQDELRVKALGAGTFQVQVREAGTQGSRMLHEGTVTLDGKGETRLEVDAR